MCCTPSRRSRSTRPRQYRLRFTPAKGNPAIGCSRPKCVLARRSAATLRRFLLLLESVAQRALIQVPPFVRVQARRRSIHYRKSGAVRPRKMKTIATTVLAVLFGTSLAFSHQMEGGSTEGLFGLKSDGFPVPAVKSAIRNSATTNRRRPRQPTNITITSAKPSRKTATTERKYENNKTTGDGALRCHRFNRH